MESTVFRNAWKWYGAFCLANSLLNVFACALCLDVVSRSVDLQVAWFGQEVADQLPPTFVAMLAGVAGVVAAIFGVGNALILRAPMTKLWWVIHLLNIAVGLASGLFTLPCLWLITQWLRPEVRSVFVTPIKKSR